MKRCLLVAGLLMALVAGLPRAASAASVTFTGSGGSLAASATFTISGTTLTVVLTNTSTFDVLAPADVLTGIFFDIAGGYSLTPVSALLSPGSTVLFDAQGQPAGGNVGGEWAYEGNLPSGAPASRGISSAGLNYFGQANFNGPDLDPPTAVNGMNYGILSAGDNPLTGNAPVTGGEPFIKNSVTFTLNVSATGLDLATLSNVRFQYGTGLTEPYLIGCLNGDCRPNIPEPGLFVLVGLGIAMAGRRFRRRLA